MPTPQVQAVLAEVDAWFADQMQRPPISHNVETYNQAHAACADLKRRLHVVITGEEPTPIATDPKPDSETPKAVKSAGTKE